MKYRFTFVKVLIAFLLFSINLFAQNKLNSSYVAAKINYLSGEDLPDDNILKYTYVKYTFTPTGEFGSSSAYNDKGLEYLYQVSGNRLMIKTLEGSVINTLRIMEWDNNKMVLVSASATGALDDAMSLQYTFYNEKLVQRSMPLKADDIFSIKENDTVYKSGQKIYASFKGSSFQRYLQLEIGKKNLNPKDVELISTFIINENGKPDSLRILQGISKSTTKNIGKLSTRPPECGYRHITTEKLLKY